MTSIPEGVPDPNETPDERAERQVEAWRALAGGWVPERSFEKEVADIYAARTVGRDVDT